MVVAVTVAVAVAVAGETETETERAANVAEMAMMSCFVGLRQSVALWEARWRWTKSREVLGR